MLRFRTREASRREPIASPDGRSSAMHQAETSRHHRQQGVKNDTGTLYRFANSRWDAWLSVWPATLRRPFFASPPICRAQQYRTQQLSPTTHSVRLDRGIWILRCCLITEAKRDHWSTRAGRNWKRDRRRNLRLVRRASSGSVSPFDITTSKQLLRCGAAHGACCAASRVCLGGGLSCWPPLCLSRSSPDAVTPPSPNLMGRPRRDVRSRSRACPSRFSPPVVA